MKVFKSAAAITLAVLFSIGFIGSARAATSVNLGAAGSFAVLAGSGITNSRYAQT